MTDTRLSDLVQAMNEGRINRRQFIQRALALGVSLPALALALGPGAGAAPASPPRVPSSRSQTDATTLIIADNLAGNWITLDPARIYEVNSQAAMNVVYECLYHLPDSTKADQFEPLLAEAMPDVSADGKVVTIKLRPGVKFHNTGNEMTSADWIYSWNRLKAVADNPSFLAEYVGTYEAVDPLTLRLTLETPNAALVPILAATPLSVTDSKAVMEQGGADLTSAGTPEVQGTIDFMTKQSAGTGPYRVTTWDIETEVVVEAHADYWGGAPKLQRIIWRNVGDPNTQLQLVQTGEIDIAYAVDPDKVAEVEADPNLQIFQAPTLNLDYLAFNTSEAVGGPLAKKELRQAIAYAIDYDGIINGLSGGASIRPATMIPLGLLGTDEVKDLAYKPDLAKAQELFATIGGPVELTLTYGADASSSNGVSLDVLLAKIQADLQKIDGLTVKLNPMDQAQRLADFRAAKIAFTFSGWSADYPDVHAYAEPFGKTGGAAAKRVNYSNPQVDALLAQGIGELDPEKRKQAYIDLQKLMIDDAAFIALEQPIDRKPASKAVQNVTTHSIYMIQLHYASKTA